jgi:hypothetical protein
VRQRTQEADPGQTRMPILGMSLSYSEGSPAATIGRGVLASADWGRPRHNGSQNPRRTWVLSYLALDCEIPFTTAAVFSGWLTRVATSAWEMIPRIRWSLSTTGMRRS